MKTVRHLNLGGEFGKPPAIEEAPRPRSEQQTAALVAALRAAAGGRSDEQVALVERWADGVAFFHENLPARMLSHCCALLQCVSLSAGQTLFSRGDRHDSFFAVVAGAVLMEEAGERVELTPPAGLGERVLEAEGEEHSCSATVTGIGDGTVLARLTVEDYRTAVTIAIKV